MSTCEQLGCAPPQAILTTTSPRHILLPASTLFSTPYSKPTTLGRSSSRASWLPQALHRRCSRNQSIAIRRTRTRAGIPDKTSVNTTTEEQPPSPTDASEGKNNGSPTEQSSIHAAVQGNGSPSPPKKRETVVAPTLDNASLPVSARKSRMPHRWRVVAMMALSFVLCNMDKVNMSVAVIPMASELGWSATDRGLVSSAFFWGYSLTQVPAGWLSTRIGGARILFAGVLLWSLGTLIAPPAANVSLLALCATRVFVRVLCCGCCCWGVLCMLL